MKKRSTMILVSVAILLLGLVGYALAGQHSMGDNVSERQARELLAVAPEQLQAALAEAGISVDYEKLLHDTETLLRYPPNSFRLHPGAADLIDYHLVRVPPERIHEINAKQPEELPVLCSLSPNANILPEGVKLVARLSCLHSRGAKQALPITLNRVALVRNVLQPDGLQVKQVHLPAPEITQESPSSIVIAYAPAASDWGNLMLTTEFSVSFDGRTITSRIGTEAFASPIAPAHFVRVVSDTAAKGSLRVEVEVMVKLAGRYTIEANLMRPSGEPLAYSFERVRLKSGLNRVALTFFGRIFHDQSADGPYVLRGLRGIQHTDLDPELLMQSPEKVTALLSTSRPNGPDKRIIPPYAKDYQTAVYTTSDFSFEEYQSPEKTKRLRMLRSLANAQR